MIRKNFRYYKIFKPYGMLSRFTDPSGRTTLKDLYDFPKDIYPVGRLDADSEGLLLLTNDKSLTDFLLNPLYQHKREYLVQVEGIPHEEDLDPLKKGLVVKGWKTLPADAEIIPSPSLPPRIPPIRERKNIPDSWIRIIIAEGKNRQVRRMTAAIGYPTLRLIRVRIENVFLGNMSPGEVKALTENEINDLLKVLKAVK